MSQSNSLRNCTKLVLCSSEPKTTECPVGYMHCGTGCISDNFVCDGMVNCPGEGDESHCIHIM